MPRHHQLFQRGTDPPLQTHSLSRDRTRSTVLHLHLRGGVSEWEVGLHRCQRPQRMRRYHMPQPPIHRQLHRKTDLPRNLRSARLVRESTAQPASLRPNLFRRILRRCERPQRQAAVRQQMQRLLLRPPLGRKMRRGMPRWQLGRIAGPNLRQRSLLVQHQGQLQLHQHRSRRLRELSLLPR